MNTAGKKLRSPVQFNIWDLTQKTRSEFIYFSKRAKKITDQKNIKYEVKSLLKESSFHIGIFK